MVSARELSLQEIRRIRDQIPDEMEIECFVHGAMCISYSGRCLLSNYFTGRDANQGACTHPCRWKYAVVEETRPGEYLPVYENERGTFLFNSKDLCMIEHIPELVEAGIDSLKIEGRMKTALYVATVARTYRKAIDDYFDAEENYAANLDWYRTEIAKCTHRQFSTGFYFGKPGEEGQIYDSSTYVNEYTYLGMIEEVWEGELSWERESSLSVQRGENLECAVELRAKPVVQSQVQAADGTKEWPPARFEQRNKFSVGDRIEIMKPDGRNLTAFVEAMYNERWEVVDSCPHARQTLWVRLSEAVEKYDLLRQKNETV